MAHADSGVPATVTLDASIPRMDWLDYLRFFCAIVVMLHHYMVVAVHPAISHGISDFGLFTEGARFVPIAISVFMMISGMMITLIAQRQASATFAANRFARIYPTFLLCMVITAMLSPLGPARFYDSWEQMTANLFIHAPAFGYRYVDMVYWTLAIEVNFYLAMTLLILSGGIRHLQWVIVGLLGAQLASLFIEPQWPLIGRDYYFIVAGMVMALLYQRRSQRLNTVLLAISLFLCIQASAVYARAGEFDRTIAGALTVAAFALFLFMRGRTFTLPFAERIGSMTYPLYLLHCSLGLTIFYWWMTEANKWLLVLGTTALFILIAFVIDDVMVFRLRPLWKRIARATVVWPLVWWETRQQVIGATDAAVLP